MGKQTLVIWTNAHNDADRRHYGSGLR